MDNAQTIALLPNPDMGGKALAARPSAMPRELAEPMGPSKLKMISVFHAGLTENLEWPAVMLIVAYFNFPLKW